MLEFVTASILYLVCAIGTVKGLLYFRWDKQRYKDLCKSDQDLMVFCLVFWCLAIIFIIFMETGKVLDKLWRKIL